MKIEVSLGEAIDKYCILELKLEKISNEIKRQEIQKELLALQECQEIINNNKHYYKLLYYVNKLIWELTDKIKILDNIPNCFTEYTEISKQIFDNNQKRFRIKNIFNKMSEIKEQKSYTETVCKINIKDYDTALSKIPEILFISLHYDKIVVNQEYLCLFPQFSSTEIWKFEIDINKVVINQEEREMFDFTPIVYISSGTFGDYIHQLSIINENYYKTGRKGILYIAEKECFFRNGIINTYNDTYQVIKNQKYIQDYKIWNNEPFDINLSEWRSRPDIFDNNHWSQTFKHFYQIDWGKRKWINTEIDKKWKNAVFVYTIEYRDTININFSKIYSLYGNDVIFITNNESDYIFFKNKYGIDVPLYIPTTFIETCIAINSCKLFVGALSGLLTIAHACHTPQIVGLSNHHLTNIRMLDVDKIFPNTYIGTNHL